MVSTDLFVKSTERNHFLHYTSSHPEHTKRSVIFSQTLRVSRICSNDSDFVRHLGNMKSWFSERVYPSDLVEDETKKVKFIPNVNNRNRGKSIKGISFVLTYHPKLKSLSKILTKNLYLLYMDKEVKKVFTRKPIISFRSARKLSNYLVRAKMYPIERIVGSKNCGSKRCEVCINVNETSTLTSTVTGETFIINHKFDCNARCLVYLLTCRKCEIQHVGQTVDQFRSIWNNYKSDSRKYSRGGSCTLQHLLNHYCSSGHAGFLDDVSITFIDKTDPSDPLKREDYWRRTLKTMAPFGLNIEESV